MALSDFLQSYLHPKQQTPPPSLMGQLQSFAKSMFQQEQPKPDRPVVAKSPSGFQQVSATKVDTKQQKQPPTSLFQDMVQTGKRIAPAVSAVKKAWDVGGFAPPSQPKLSMQAPLRPSQAPPQTATDIFLERSGLGAIPGAITGAARLTGSAALGGIPTALDIYNTGGAQTAKDVGSIMQAASSPFTIANEGVRTIPGVGKPIAGAVDWTGKAFSQAGHMGYVPPEQRVLGEPVNQFLQTLANPQRLAQNPATFTPMQDPYNDPNYKPPGWRQALGDVGTLGLMAVGGKLAGEGLGAASKAIRTKPVNAGEAATMKGQFEDVIKNISNAREEAAANNLGRQLTADEIIQNAAAKKQFFKDAKAFHPDTIANASPELQTQYANAFKELEARYQASLAGGKGPSPLTPVQEAAHGAAAQGLDILAKNPTELRFPKIEKALGTKAAAAQGEAASGLARASDILRATDQGTPFKRLPSPEMQTGVPKGWEVVRPVEGGTGKIQILSDSHFHAPDGTAADVAARPEIPSIQSTISAKLSEAPEGAQVRVGFIRDPDTGNVYPYTQTFDPAVLERARAQEITPVTARDVRALENPVSTSAIMPELTPPVPGGGPRDIRDMQNATPLEEYQTILETLGPEEAVRYRNELRKQYGRDALQDPAKQMYVIDKNGYPIPAPQEPTGFLPVRTDGGVPSPEVLRAQALAEQPTQPTAPEVTPAREGSAAAYHQELFGPEAPAPKGMFTPEGSMAHDWLKAETTSEVPTKALSVTAEGAGNGIAPPPKPGEAQAPVPKGDTAKIKGSWLDNARPMHIFAPEGYKVLEKGFFDTKTAQATALADLKTGIAQAMGKLPADKVYTTHDEFTGKAKYPKLPTDRLKRIQRLLDGDHLTPADKTFYEQASTKAQEELGIAAAIRKTADQNHVTLVGAGALKPGQYIPNYMSHARGAYTLDQAMKDLARAKEIESTNAIVDWRSPPSEPGGKVRVSAPETKTRTDTDRFINNGDVFSSIHASTMSAYRKSILEKAMNETAKVVGEKYDDATYKKATKILRRLANVDYNPVARAAGGLIRRSLIGVLNWGTAFRHAGFFSQTAIARGGLINFTKSVAKILSPKGFRSMADAYADSTIDYYQNAREVLNEIGGVEGSTGGQTKVVRTINATTKAISNLQSIFMFLEKGSLKATRLLGHDMGERQAKTLGLTGEAADAYARQFTSLTNPSIGEANMLPLQASETGATAFQIATQKFKTFLQVLDSAKKAVASSKAASGALNAAAEFEKEGKALEARDARDAATKYREEARGHTASVLKFIVASAVIGEITKQILPNHDWWSELDPGVVQAYEAFVASMKASNKTREGTSAKYVGAATAAGKSLVESFTGPAVQVGVNILGAKSEFQSIVSPQTTAQEGLLRTLVNIIPGVAPLASLKNINIPGAAEAERKLYDMIPPELTILRGIFKPHSTVNTELRSQLFDTGNEAKQTTVEHRDALKQTAADYIAAGKSINQFKQDWEKNGFEKDETHLIPYYYKNASLDEKAKMDDDHMAIDTATSFYAYPKVEAKVLLTYMDSLPSKLAQAQFLATAKKEQLFIGKGYDVYAAMKEGVDNVPGLKDRGI